MSRIGNKAISITAGVEVKISGKEVSVKGPKGELKHTLTPRVEASVDADSNEVVVTRQDDSRFSKAEHGLNRSLISNMIVGVSTGWKKELEIRGTGFRGAVQGNKLNLNLGYSHPINYEIPDGIKVTMPEPTKIIVEGSDKQLVGQVSANIRFYRKPDAYKGKGVRYTDEHIALKEGKSAGK
ncbi:50S ribosomal protein L6 [Lentisphaera araneosa HTCC2155]|uniref:Large ribosomal subunit protein uL6 n=1 Tax=Lentisphaera araneosa HTCC2155 TaxID=313628 RepID=A6DRC5_9BACT|nr:50S ribosomal protein L6 [Lentisphaera araneosa]EDM25872.1 50S ribosomal protein L6 [Lentisphaera araneosa HTCC2155]